MRLGSNVGRVKVFFVGDGCGNRGEKSEKKGADDGKGEATGLGPPRRNVIGSPSDVLAAGALDERAGCDGGNTHVLAAFRAWNVILTNLSNLQLWAVN